jgi:hypothetical protein
LLLSVASCYGWQRWTGIPDVAWGCDLFGHLVMTKNIRRAWAERRAPDFRFESPQGRELIGFMKSTGRPVELWHEMVAPHAHRYVPRVDRVSDQYSPGTGLLISFFPEHRAVGWLARFTIAVLFAFGAAGILLRAGTPGGWITAGWAALAAFQGVHMLVAYGVGNYSLYAVLLPSVLAAFLTACAWSRGIRGQDSRWAALAAGLFGGLAMFIRIPSAVQFLRFLVLLRRRDWPYLLLGGAITGFLPQAWYQQTAAGAWWATTYDSVNASAPQLRAIPHYIRFYLLNGLGSPFFVIPAISGISYFALRGWSRWKELGRAALVSWGVPALYFLTHVPAVSYYLCPADLTGVWLLAWGVWFEYREPAPRDWRIHLPRLAPAAAFVLLALVPLWAYVSGARIPMDPPWDESLFAADQIPGELRDPKAWVWSDVTNGAFWYYGDRPAFNIAFGGDPELRSRVFHWAQGRNEPQFLIMDGGGSAAVAKEIRNAGGTLEPRGKVFGMEYFRVFVAPG